MKTALFRRTTAAAACAVAVSASTLLSGSALAAPANPQSTPIAFPAADGQLMSYVVNAKAANANKAREAVQAVEAAGGVAVQEWPEIGVVVAQSELAGFRTDVLKYGNSSVESVGATRTITVAEGTPEGIATPWQQAPQPAPQLRSRQLANAGLLYGDATFDGAALDPREGEQWNLAQVKADQAHQLTDGSRDVLVGVLDSGIDPDHPDLKANIDVANSVNCTNAGRPDTSPTGWNPTTSYHGTHVAGIIGAARNGVGIVGVAPNVRMASVKVVNDAGSIYPEYAICGFMWAGLKGMDVTNNSYYIDPVQFWCGDQPDQLAVRVAVERAVDWSTDQGTVHAAAAGNASYDLANKTTDNVSPNDAAGIQRQINNGCKDMPTELDGVVTVASTDQAGKLSSFSNRGLNVIDVAAPGSRILSTLPNNSYGLLSGTSMASPHVAGVLALMKSEHPGWKPNQLVSQLRKQAQDHLCMPSATPAGSACTGTLRNNSYYGEGIIDALQAVL
ncbi:MULTISPECIES: S8 family serine peptidase [unclassified Arthrobacter]|uniref:S8 family serine peptidase n=1 Tax=unclassified Arthrobacter TaxID=235627 RepID=UPI00159DB9A3|nr:MULTISPECIES: S8 family serine peptidase [unclassified Arthrobacter]MCQ9163069.1 S8 family serine peptidase [Arthrobacter sp. STN4]NVM97524.1 S8 family serine peptidase [Arthrobacter sp. SDTb3-6]